MKKVYLVMTILGFILPYIFFIRFLTTHGFDLALLVEQLFVNDISTFFAADLLLTAVVFLIFLWVDHKRRLLRNVWVYLLATLLVGPSFSIPLYLCVHEGKE